MGVVSERNCACSSMSTRLLACAGHSSGLCLAAKILIAITLGLGALATFTTDARADSFVEFDFNLPINRARSTLFIQLFDDRPLTVANFLQYVNGALYNNTLMHQL